MQRVRFKNGLELRSLLVDKDMAKGDIVRMFVGKAQELKPEVLMELNRNFPGVPGAMILLRMVNELVDLSECSSDFQELVRVQRELIGKCIGEISTGSEDDERLIEKV